MLSRRIRESIAYGIYEFRNHTGTDTDTGTGTGTDTDTHMHTDARRYSLAH